MDILRQMFGQELAHENNLCYYILGHRLIY